MLKRQLVSLLAATTIGLGALGVPAQTAYAGGPKFLEVLGDTFRVINEAAKPVDDTTFDSVRLEMEQNLYDSQLLYAAAFYDVEKALGMDPASINDSQVAFQALSANRGSYDREYIRQSNAVKVDAKAIAAAAKAALDSGDRARLDYINRTIKHADSFHHEASVRVALAWADAFRLLKFAQSKGGGLENVIHAIEDAQHLLGAQKANRKALKGALKKYKATQNIKAPSKEEAKEVVDAWFKG